MHRRHFHRAARRSCAAELTRVRDSVDQRLSFATRITRGDAPVMASSATIIKLPTYYRGIWVTLMSFAIAYMGLVAVRPDIVTEALPTVKIASVLMDEDDAELRRVASESDSMRQQLFNARAELNGLRGELARRADRESTLTLKVAALEAREAKLAETQAADATAAAAKASAVARLAEKAKLSKQAQPAMSAVEKLAATAGAPPGAVHQQVASIPLQSTAPVAPQRPVTTNPVETASISAPATAATPKAEAKPDGTTSAAAIQLGTGPSLDALRLNWSALSLRQQAALQKLQPRYTTSREPSAGGVGPAFDLIAGPLPNAAEAQKLCETLRAAYVSCRVTTFNGNAL